MALLRSRSGSAHVPRARGPAPPSGAPARRAAGRSLRARARPSRLRNVVGVLPQAGATRRPRGAHYDTQPLPRGFVGANDGAAGTPRRRAGAGAGDRAAAAGAREVRFVSSTARSSRAPRPALRTSRPSPARMKAYAAAHAGEVGELVLLATSPAAACASRARARPTAPLGAPARGGAPSGHRRRLPVAGGHRDHRRPHPFLREGVPAIDLIDWDYRSEHGPRSPGPRLAAQPRRGRRDRARARIARAAPVTVGRPGSYHGGDGRP
jgi:hypothetical protein